MERRGFKRAGRPADSSDRVESGSRVKAELVGFEGRPSGTGGEGGFGVGWIAGTSDDPAGQGSGVLAFEDHGDSVDEHVARDPDGRLVRGDSKVALSADRGQVEDQDGPEAFAKQPSISGSRASTATADVILRIASSRVRRPSSRTYLPRIRAKVP